MCFLFPLVSNTLAAIIGENSIDQVKKINLKYIPNKLIIGSKSENNLPLLKNKNNRELINACTDLSDGGIALAAFELAEMGNIGMEIDISDTDTLFGEDQAR